MVKVGVITTNINGVIHEAVQLTRESPAALYSVEILTVGIVRRVDGLETEGFPNKLSTQELMHAYFNVNDMAERYLQSDDVVMKSNLVKKMQRAIDSAL